MNINLELYRVFYVVASVGNITRAAQKLMISQPAISKSIKNLEDQLGGKLFLRTKKGVTLTQEGQIFYENIKKAMEYIDVSEHKFTDLINLEGGNIKIGVSNSYGVFKYFLKPYLIEFNKLYPKISIQIVEDYTNEIIRKLKDGLFDMAILKFPYKERNDIDKIKCKEIQDCLVVGPSYQELTKKVIPQKDLDNYPILGLIKPSDITGSYFEKVLKDNNLALESSIECNTVYSFMELTKAGLGIGYTIKEHIEDEIKNKELFVLDIEPKIPSRYIGIATKKNTLPSFSTKKLIELIENDIKRNNY